MSSHVRAANDDVTAEELLASRPLRAIDAAVAELAAAPSDERLEELLDVVAQATYACRDLESLSASPTFRDLFRAKLSKSDRRFVGAVLLRVLSANRDALPPDLINRVVQLFDDVLADRVYRLIDVDPASDARNKMLEMPFIAGQAVKRFSDAIAELDGVESIRRFQQTFMRACQDAAFGAVIRPFLPEDLLGRDFATLVRRLDRCANLNATGANERYQQARADLSAYADAAAACDSEFADRFLVALADRFDAALRRAFDASSLAYHAELTLRGGDKKYPLHREDAELRLSLDLANCGEGPAQGVVLTLDGEDAVAPLEETRLIGDVPPEGLRLTVPALVLEPASEATLRFALDWRNADETIGHAGGTVCVAAQQANVDWDGLATLNPYPNKAVRDPDRLAGRKGILRSLEALATGPETGSTRISGQKRIGKSSIARSLESRLKSNPGAELVVAYVDVNKLGFPEDQPNEAVLSLMRAVARTISRQTPALGALEPPAMTGSLEGFADFMSEVAEREPGKSVLVILDEFDELPNGAFERGGPGDAMFRTFKSFSSEGDCGFFLVGGERLELALSRQSDRLNAFTEFRVDYLGEDDEDDFRDLVERPVAGYLEFESSAITRLREFTGGHPFYTFAVCREVVSQARDRRDAHVTADEVADGYRAALQNAPASSFAHVWFDHIFEDSASVNAIADRRVRVLLAWSACLRRGEEAIDDRVVEEAVTYDLTKQQTRDELRSFVNRKILQVVDSRYHASSRFFEDWLVEWGSEKIRETQDLRSLDRFADRDDELRVRSAELTALTETWPSYRSLAIGPEKVRAWLEQFGDSRRQRLALGLLESVRFFTSRQVRDHLRDAHRVSRRETRVDLDARAANRQIKSRDYAVCYLESDGKSAQLVAQAYADANAIARECVSSILRASALVEKYSVQRLVLVDDFIGTGGTASARLTAHADAIRELAQATGREAVLAVVAAFEEGLTAVQETIDAHELPVMVVVGELLDDADKAFSDVSRVFDDASDRLVARRMVEELGRNMGSDEPLGTGGLQALVVFEHNCPNNTLPVLWKTSEYLDWTPLFARVTG